MNFLASRISPISSFIRGALEVTRADYNNVIVRTGCSRVLSKRRPPHRKWPGYRHKFENGQEYYGFTYYPNHNEIEPDWQPTELFLIKRRKTFEKNPYWEKRILKYFQVDASLSDWAIVLNSEVNNKILWQIKHLISITPITFPDGYPTEENISSCRLYENGEFRISKNLGPDSKSLEAVADFQKNRELPTKAIVEKVARIRWLHPFPSNTHI